MMWFLTQNKARNIFHSILSSDKGYVDFHCIIILYYNENDKNHYHNSYIVIINHIVVVLCLLVTLNQ